MITIKVGKFEFEVRDVDSFEALPFVPFFQRYLSISMDNRDDIRDAITEKQKEFEKNPEDEEVKLELVRLVNLLNAEVELKHTQFFTTINKFEWMQVKKFLVSVITSWNLAGKDGKVLPITSQNLDNVSPYLLPFILESVTEKVLLGKAGEINFLDNSSESSKATDKSKS